MSETERMLAEVYVNCPVCFALIHTTHKEHHWKWHTTAISQMAHGMFIVGVDNEMKAQGVTWPGDLTSEPEEEAP